MRYDGYVNLLNKYGTMQDNSTAWEFHGDGLVPDMMLTDLYESNGLFARIIDAPAEEMVKHGFDLGLKNTEVETYINEELEALGWEELASTAVKWARLYGGALGVMLINDGGGIAEPLRTSRIKSIEEIRVFERAVVTPDYTSLYYNFRDPSRRRTSKFGMPEYFQVNSIYGTFWVHESRCLVFRNGVLPEGTMNPYYRFWGLPEYIRTRRELRETITAHGTGVKLLERAVQAIYSMKDLANLLATDDGTEIVLKRLQTIDMARGILNSIAIDSEGESYDFKTIPFSGVKDIIDATCNMLSSVTNIPQTILFGRSPAGENATGDSDLEGWYNFIERLQKLMLKAPLDNVVSKIIAAGIYQGKIKDEVKHKNTFNKLWSMTEGEQADVDQKKAQTQQVRAQTAEIYVNMSVLEPSQVAKGLRQETDFDVEGLLESIEPDGDEGALWGDDPTGESPAMDKLKAAWGQEDTPSAIDGTNKTPTPDKLKENWKPRSDADDTPSGVGVIVVKDGKILAGIREGEGTVCGPGGHIEVGETPAAAAIRETQEEFGITPLSLKSLGQIEGMDEEYGEPYIYLCTEFDGEPKCRSHEISPAFWIDPEDVVTSGQVFPPFAESLKLLNNQVVAPVSRLTNDGQSDNIGEGETKQKAVESFIKEKEAEREAETAPSPSEEKNSGANKYIKNFGTTSTDGGNGADSLSKYTQTDGTLTPEREALHRQIIEDTFKDAAPSDNPTVMFMGGGSGAGKGTLLKSGFVEIPDGSATIDSDSVKARLPEYKEMLDNGGPEAKDAAAYAHKESSNLANRMTGIALESKFNYIDDGTGAELSKMEKKIQQAKEAGYRTEAAYVTIQIEEAVRRAAERAKRTGRNVMENVIIEKHKKVSRTLPIIAPKLDSVKLYDNSGSKPVLIATGGSGKPLSPEPGQEQKLKDFITKGE